MLHQFFVGVMGDDVLMRKSVAFEACRIGDGMTAD